MHGVSPDPGPHESNAPLSDVTAGALSPAQRLGEQLRNWRRPQAAMQALFSAEELARLDTMRPRPGSETRTVVIPSWENPFARVGLAATLPLIGQALTEHCSSVLHVSPLHLSLVTEPRRDLVRGLGEITVPFAGADVTVQLYDMHGGGNHWIFFTARDFFTSDGGRSRRDPYAYSTENLAEQQGAGSYLLRDSLFASKALPLVLSALGFREDIVVHIHDWHFASCALTLKEALLAGELDSARAVLTMHTPLDHVLPASRLGYITARCDPRQWPSVDAGAPRERETVLERMVPLLDAPVSTGGMFAQELTADPLQTQYLVPHLQGVFREQQVIGIVHGSSVEVPEPFSRSALAAARAGSYEPILHEKMERRQLLLSMLERDQHAGDRCIGSWTAEDGRPLHELAADVPIFLMIGSPDPSQSAFDIFARAIATIPRGRNRYAFIPSLGQGGDEMLRELSGVAEARPGEVLVYPEGLEGPAYETFLGGATWGVMPCLYAPFGSALEFYARGTPVVARATGGLREQVVDVDASPGEGTGVLFSEQRQGQPQPRWYALLSEGAVRQRHDDPMFRSMRESLSAGLARATRISSVELSLYAEMLPHLEERLAAFPWRNAAAQITLIHDCACRS
jgi:glycogen synthase